ncbi:MAG: hypothetical protein AAFW46_05930 [Pseudomonadota bacterium]
MKASKFTDAQKAFILKQAMDGALMQEMVKGEIASDGGALAKAMNAAIATGAAEDFLAAQIDADPVEVTTA